MKSTEALTQYFINSIFAHFVCVKSKITAIKQEGKIYFLRRPIKECLSRIFM